MEEIGAEGGHVGARVDGAEAGTWGRQKVFASSGVGIGVRWVCNGPRGADEEGSV